MNKEIYDALQNGVTQLCGVEEAILQAAQCCFEALAEFSNATAGSSQPEVNGARQNLLQADRQLQGIGNLLMRSAMTYQNYSVTYSPDNMPVALSPTVQEQCDQGSPYADANENRSSDQSFAPGPLLSAAYAQYPTTLTACTSGEELKITIPGGYVSVSFDQPTTQGVTGYIDDVQVTAGQQQGKGTHLVQMAAREASLRGANSLAGCYISPYSLRALGKAVGGSNIVIQPPGSNTNDYLDANNYDEAVAALDQYKANTSENDDVKGVLARVNLSKPEVQSRLFRR